jgi:hypothetical protein
VTFGGADKMPILGNQPFAIRLDDAPFKNAARLKYFAATGVLV